MMGTLCAQLFLLFYTDQFETLQALLSWSVDVHVALALLSINFLPLLNLVIFGAEVLQSMHVEGKAYSW